MDHATVKRLLTLAFACSPGDLSILEVALQKGRASQLLTGHDSPNFYFWSACVEEGLMERLPDLTTNAGGTSISSPVFTISDDAWADLSDLQDIISRNYEPRNYHMSRLYNTLCHPFVESFYTQLQTGGGKDDDVETLVAMLLTRLITRRFKAPEYENKLMLVHARTRQMLKNYSDPATATPPQG